jgi:phosphoglycolate phosphatase-like HAD superfamily hydrolase
MIKAIIFDYDGIIVESMDIKARAFAELFKEYPGQVKAIVEYHMTHGGLSRYEKFEHIYREMLKLPLSSRKKEELGEQFAAFVYQAVVKCPLVDGAMQVLEKYHRRMDLFVVSGTPDEEIRAIVKERGLKKYFVGVFGSPETKAGLNQRILDEYKYEPGTVMFVGDSIDDWEGVQGTGIKFIGRKINGKDPFAGRPVDGLINDLFDLEKFIDEK